jgi:betaine-aldehyde dehydrogenase
VDQRPHPDHQRDVVGGVKRSGYGKDMSQYAFGEYTTVKHAMFDITNVARKPWHRTVFTCPP